MKFRIKTTIGWEEYNEDDINNITEASEWAKATVDEFNEVETERYGGSAAIRELFEVEMLFDTSPLAIGKRLHTQDNRMTAEPIFAVEEKRDGKYVLVQPFFTNDGAMNHIECNRHNLKEPRIYVKSGQDNIEWKNVRSHLMTQNLCTVGQVLDRVSDWDKDAILELVRALLRLSE